MPMLRPTLSFTLPSLHDHTQLECRVYHATSQRPLDAAVIAHPYAPLGGCYDDPVVEHVAVELLAAGYVVGTFNFRGAGRSQGRTSWTAKAETSDYTSVAGFLLLYMRYLTSPPAGGGGLVVVDPPPADDDRGAVFLFAGYSYGAMVTSQLPSLPTVLAPFDAPAVGTAAAEIRLRAQHLAERHTAMVRSSAAGRARRSSASPSPLPSPGIRIGGDEHLSDKSPTSPRGRASKDISPDKRHKPSSSQAQATFDQDRRRRLTFELTEEAIRKGVNDVLAKTVERGKRPRGDAKDGDLAADVEDEHMEPIVAEMKLPAPAYLLISPLQGVINSLATMSWLPASGKKSTAKDTARSEDATTSEPAPSGVKSPRRGGRSSRTAASQHDEVEQKLLDCRTLAIYGDRDGFVSAKTLRSWARRLQEAPQSKFRAHEVSNAGHFWAQDCAALDVLSDAVRTFVRSLIYGVRQDPKDPDLHAF